MPLPTEYARTDPVAHGGGTRTDPVAHRVRNSVPRGPQTPAADAAGGRWAGGSLRVGSGGGGSGAGGSLRRRAVRVVLRRRIRERRVVGQVKIASWIPRSCD